MQIIDHSIEMIYPTSSEGWVQAAKYIELAARNCYKSEEKITNDSWIPMIRNLKERNHGAMLEFGSAMVRVTTDRGILAEFTRHRLFSYAVESTRYCNYSKDKFGNELTFVRPVELQDNALKVWKDTMQFLEKTYLDLIAMGTSPQNARSILPNSLKTEMIVKGNLREWMHFFELRTSKAAHLDMRAVATLIQDEFQRGLPELFA